ncbi:MAG: hypothetical protein ACYTKC_10350 [Planctomycetota bacterium]|jgi:hypothetical protein
MKDKYSAFESRDEGSEELFREGVGSYFNLKLALKAKLPVRQPKRGG